MAGPFIFCFYMFLLYVIMKLDESRRRKGVEKVKAENEESATQPQPVPDWLQELQAARKKKAEVLDKKIQELKELAKMGKSKHPPARVLKAADSRSIFYDEAAARLIYDKELEKGWGHRGSCARVFSIAFEWGKFEGQRRSAGYVQKNNDRPGGRIAATADTADTLQLSGDGQTEGLQSGPPMACDS